MKKKKKPIDQVTIAYIAAGIILAAVMTLFGVSAFLRVNRIVVEGMVTYTPEEVAEASGISRGDNLLYLNRRTAEDSIRSQLTYVNFVEIKRDMPDTLLIEIRESIPLAYIPFAGDALIIDHTGRILDIIRIVIGTPVEVAGVRLTEIRGVTVNEATAGSMPKVEQGTEQSYKAMQDILTAMEREQIINDVNYLDVTNITNISFGYSGKYRVILGGLTGHRQKISALPSTISQVIDWYQNAGGVLNLTDPSGDYKFNPE